MNNNLTNNIVNNTVTHSKKGKFAFIIILFIILLIIIVLVIKTTLNKQKLQNRLIKNTFFTEMNFNVKPYDAWCFIKNNDSGLPLGNCKPICIRGKKYTNGIPQNITHIKGNHSTMFWFKIKKELFAPTNEALDVDYPLVYFSNSSLNPQDYLPTNEKYLGFFIKPINNTMTLKDNTNEITKVYNLPYDKWICITSVSYDGAVDIYINGRLLRTAIVSSLSNYFTNSLKWGPFPGDLAFLEINNDPNELNAESIYNNFKYYYEIIDKYNNHSDKKILLNTPFFKSPFKPLTQWDILKGRKHNRTYSGICY